MLGTSYKASPNMTKFHLDDHFVRAIMGPIGSGKSVACCVELIMKGLAQEQNHEGFRQTKFAIVRNTYRELVDTTIRTWFDWLPEELGVFLKKDMTWRCKIPLPDGTVFDMQILFRALDKPQDVKKLLSLELTGAWINEARELPKAIIDMIIGRIGRYPRKVRNQPGLPDFNGPTWHGLIMDTNPPDSDHWWYKLFEIARPGSYKLFKQPSGLSPEAENIENLPADYYQKMQDGKDKEWINVYVHGNYGFVSDGKPVWPEYKDDVHSTDEEIELNPKSTIYIGVDFGLTPAAVFGVESSSGRWIVFDELVCEDMGTKRFAKLLNKKINKSYGGFDIEIYGDPAGDHRAQTDEVTPFMIMSNEGVEAIPAYTNDIVIRLEAVASVLTRMDFSGNPGFLVGPKAVMCRKALAGGYKYRRMAVTGQERYMDKPDKNRYSHVSDALQYMMLGGGEGGKVVESKNSLVEIDYSNSDRVIV